MHNCSFVHAYLDISIVPASLCSVCVFVCEREGVSVCYYDYVCILF